MTIVCLYVGNAVAVDSWAIGTTCDEAYASLTRKLGFSPEDENIRTLELGGEYVLERVKKWRKV